MKEKSVTASISIDSLKVIDEEAKAGKRSRSKQLSLMADEYALGVLVERKAKEDMKAGKTQIDPEFLEALERR